MSVTKLGRAVSTAISVSIGIRPRTEVCKATTYKAGISRPKNIGSRDTGPKTGCFTITGFPQQIRDIIAVKRKARL